MKKLSYYFASLLLVFLASCNQSGSNSEGNQSDTSNSDIIKVQNETTQSGTPESGIMAKGGIKLIKLTDYQKYPNAKLNLVQPKADAVLQPGTNEFDFNVADFELRQQTPDADQINMANSDDGQHIHLIINDGPYSAHYNPNFSVDLKPGKYIILAFLSRSYHMSIKNPNSFVIRKITVGAPMATSKVDKFDMNGKNLFYSRPKGTYSGPDSKKVLLDFFLQNVTLSPDGYKVRATINGNVFMLTDWAPYAMENLPMGENHIKLELLDQNGNLVPGPFNSTERRFTLKP